MCERRERTSECASECNECANARNDVLVQSHMSGVWTRIADYIDIFPAIMMCAFGVPGSISHGPLSVGAVDSPVVAAVANGT